MTQPFPRWRVALIAVLGVTLSGAGWTAAVQVQNAQAAAASSSSSQAALVRLVGERCRAGQVTDPVLCRAALPAEPPTRR